MYGAPESRVKIEARKIRYILKINANDNTFAQTRLVA